MVQIRGEGCEVLMSCEFRRSVHSYYLTTSTRSQRVLRQAQNQAKWKSRIAESKRAAGLKPFSGKDDFKEDVEAIFKNCQVFNES